MSKRRATILAICEDKQQECFIRRFLKDNGWENRALRFETAPGGEGSGEQWVRTRFPDELKAYRANGGIHRLVVMVDGDTTGVTRRISQLNKACEGKNIDKRNESEKVGFFVPTRSIETWIAYLQGNPVDEEQKYPKLDFERDCQPAVTNLIQYCKSHSLPVVPPPSLVEACKEYHERISD